MYCAASQNGRKERRHRDDARKPEKSAARRNLLRGAAFCGKQSATDRNTVYNGGQGGIYHGDVHCAGADIKYFFREKGGNENLGCRGAGGRGVIHFMHDGRQPFPAEGRSARSAVGICIFRAHSDHRSFCTAGGRGKNVVYSVLCVRAAVGGLYVAV